MNSPGVNVKDISLTRALRKNKLDFESVLMFNNSVLKNSLLYSQHFIVFITHEWAQLARVFLPCKPFLPCVM